MRRLPPFPELVAFEAVARHLSFTRAADELALTQSAVSHRVRRLEQHLGVRLLERLNPGLVLTDAGRDLLPELTDCLDRLTLLGSRPARRLRVAAGAAFCAWWLAGRLPAFLATRPGVSVELVPLGADRPAPRDVDVRILWVPRGDDTSGATQRALFTEQVFPVCSPRLLPGGRPLSDAQGLCRLALLHKASGSAGEWDWSVWLRRLGLEGALHRGGELHYTEIGLTLAAAVEGAGVALARSLLVHDALQAGRLVVALERVEPLPSSKHHVARWPAARAGDRDVVAFVDWLADATRQSVVAADAMVRRVPAQAAA